jgi:hypothetical protein
MATNPNTSVTIPIFHTNAGSGSCNTMMKPMATSISPRFINAIKQQIPRVFGQNGFGADIVSTTTPALVVLLGMVF